VLTEMTHRMTALVAFAMLVSLVSTAEARGDTGAARTQPDLSDSSDIRPLELHVGTSTVINAPWPVSRVSVTNPDIADVQVLTPRQVLLTANALGSTDLILWSESEEIWHARVNVMVDLGYIRDELGKLFPKSRLEVTQSRDMVIISGQLRRAEDVDRLRSVLTAYGIKFLDTTSIAGVQQVQLHVRVAEVSRNALRTLGVNIVYGDDILLASRPAASNGSPLVDFSLDGLVVSSGTTLIGRFPGADLDLFLQALSENQYVRILAQPTLVAMSGEEASFLAGGEFPIPVVQGGTGGNATSISIEYKEFGVRLAFRPTVLGDNSIRLMVAPEVSDLSDRGAVELEGFRIPSVLTRRAQTTLELRSGQSFAMAGLLNQNISARNSRIPLLGDLPILGALFRSVRYENGETELIVLVTASLVEPSDYNMAEQTVPGDTYVDPSEWELFIDGRIEGRRKPLASADAAWLREMGLNRLYGPGAWATHDQPDAPSEATFDRPPVE
jgi:pilus assembly protein CpaC